VYKEVNGGVNAGSLKVDSGCWGTEAGITKSLYLSRSHEGFSDADQSP